MFLYVQLFSFAFAGKPDFNISPQIKMENSRRVSTSGLSCSPRLQRRRSGAPAISCAFATETQPFSSNSGRISINRSKSTSKTRTASNDEENRHPKSQDRPKKHHLALPLSEKPQENREALAGIFHRHRIADVSKAAEPARGKKERSFASSPSAWALSPGRSPEQSNFGAWKKKGGSVSSVLSYFRQQKKMPSAREETFHQLRILQTRLLQWRFVNARADVAMAVGKSTAEKKLFSIWLETFRLRNSVIEKRIQVQKLKAEIKLCGILSSQIQLLNDWERIDKRNLEAVTKSAKILRPACLNVPLVGGAKANIYSVYRAFCTAMDVMSGLEDTISRFFFQVEKMSSLLTELVMVVKQERECLEKLMETAIMTASLEAQERSLRVHLMQEMTERAAFQTISFPTMSIWS